MDHDRLLAAFRRRPKNKRAATAPNGTPKEPKEARKSSEAADEATKQDQSTISSLLKYTKLPTLHKSLKTPPPHAPRIAIIGAGSRGHAFAVPIKEAGVAHIVAVAEPDEFKRHSFVEEFILGVQGRSVAKEGDAFESWEGLIAFEKGRREKAASGEGAGDQAIAGIDAVIVCVLDEMHHAVVTALAESGLGLHVLCEKPLATSLKDALDIYASLRKSWDVLGRRTVFGIGHVLRYSPHNTLLRNLVREGEVIGEVVNVIHEEPVGYWHFSHSYVRGNWRNSTTSAPSLLTKSCHDIDFLLWLLCSPTNAVGDERPHLPSKISSMGHLSYFRKARKPKEAGTATNCFNCAYEQDCIYSAKKVYVQKLEKGHTRWPVKIVMPDIEDIYKSEGKDKAVEKLTAVLKENYDENTPKDEIQKRNWFGRCVWESDNNVCDDQTVLLSWDDDIENGEIVKGRAKKTAIMHMIAPTEMICERRGRIYGTFGEIEYDSETISVFDFRTGQRKVHRPTQAGGGHGGGDSGLATNFVKAVAAVKKGEMEAVEAQKTHLGADLEEEVRSHCAVWAAEDARAKDVTVAWTGWWDTEVTSSLEKAGLKDGFR